MNEFEIGTKVNDVITEDIIESWSENNTNIILNGATGSGKTYFVENNLHQYAVDNFKSILYLCNRTALFHQILQEKEQEGLHNIDVMLYQALQSKILKKEVISPYDFIVPDEFHYVMSDAMFGHYTDLTYDWLVSQTNSVKIFMSGTAKDIFGKLKSDGVVKEENEYVIPYSYDYVTECKFYREKYEVFNIINHILTTTDDKIIFFANSTDLAMEVHNQFKEYSAVFRCSTSSKNEKARELNNVDCIETYNRDLITFNERLLITTKALDNGIDIKDKKVKHIICDIFDLESAQQSLGRKRKIDDEDTCTFYIRNYSKKAIGNFKGGLHKNFNPVDMFVQHREEFEEKYGQDREFHTPFIFNDGDIRKYNKLAYWKMQCDDIDMEAMGERSYKSLFLERLGDTMRNVIDLEELEEYRIKGELELYLEEIKGKRLFVEERQALADMINITDDWNRQQKTKKVINGYLQVNYKMSIVDDTDRKRKLEDGSVNPNKDKMYWILVDGIVEKNIVGNLAKDI